MSAGFSPGGLRLPLLRQRRRLDLLGPDILDQDRRAAGFDRILKDVPTQGHLSRCSCEQIADAIGVLRG